MAVAGPPHPRTWPRPRSQRWLKGVCVEGEGAVRGCARGGDITGMKWGRVTTQVPMHERLTMFVCVMFVCVSMTIWLGSVPLWVDRPPLGQTVTLPGIATSFPHTPKCPPPSPPTLHYSSMHHLAAPPSPPGPPPPLTHNLQCTPLCGPPFTSGPHPPHTPVHTTLRPPLQLPHPTHPAPPSSTSTRRTRRPHG